MQTRYIFYDEQGNQGDWSEYAYDEEGRLLRSVSYNFSGSVTSQDSWEYDILGNVIGDKDHIYAYTYRLTDDV
ncbi:MAG: hypothetical protein NC417_02735 [Candidatus Gastranaerophilales bacterium]|nr:hypothetical protein [Candidatus Gastranaerophilales bacterium]